MKIIILRLLLVEQVLDQVKKYINNTRLNQLLLLSSYHDYFQ